MRVYHLHALGKWYVHPHTQHVQVHALLLHCLLKLTEVPLLLGDVSTFDLCLED